MRNLGNLEPTCVKYVDTNTVQVSLKNQAGEIICYTMRTAMLLHAVTLSMRLVNDSPAQVFRDLDVF